MERRPNTAVLYDEHGYLEGPRVHRGELYCASTLAGAVLCFAATGERRLVCEIKGVPCGLGFLPDGDLIVLEMVRRRLWRASPRGLSIYAELADSATGTIDDMFIDSQGRAYVGDLGFDLFVAPKPPQALGQILLVAPGEPARVVAQGLDFPNGIAMNRARNRLAVAESHGNRIAWYDVSSAGELAPRARTTGVAEPDGICMTSDDTLWVAQVQGDCFVRIDDTGAELERVTARTGRPIACWLSDDQRRLFCISAQTTHQDLMHGRSTCRVEAVDLG